MCSRTWLVGRGQGGEEVREAVAERRSGAELKSWLAPSLPHSLSSSIFNTHHSQVLRLNCSWTLVTGKIPGTWLHSSTPNCIANIQCECDSLGFEDVWEVFIPIWNHQDEDINISAAARTMWCGSMRLIILKLHSSTTQLPCFSPPNTTQAFHPTPPKLFLLHQTPPKLYKVKKLSF